MGSHFSCEVLRVLIPPWAAHRAWFACRGMVTVTVQSNPPAVYYLTSVCDSGCYLPPRSREAHRATVRASADESAQARWTQEAKKKRISGFRRFFLVGGGQKRGGPTAPPLSSATIGCHPCSWHKLQSKKPMQGLLCLAS